MTPDQQLDADVAAWVADTVAEYDRHIATLPDLHSKVTAITAMMCNPQERFDKEMGSRFPSPLDARQAVTALLNEAGRARLNALQEELRQSNAAPTGGSTT